MVLHKIISFLKYWYFRYIVVTELYMVEKWEKCTIHAIFGVFFLLCWYFNYAVLLTGVGKISGWLSASQFMDIKSLPAIK